MNLTSIGVDSEYLHVIHDNKQRLASWTFELIKIAKDRLFGQQNQSERIRPKLGYESPFFNNVNWYISEIRKKYRCYDLSLSDMINIGLLSYFLSQCMDIFRRSIKLHDEEKFNYMGQYCKQDQRRLIEEIRNRSIESLIAIHSVYSPQLFEIVTIDAVNVSPKKSTQIMKKGAQFGRNIVKYYQSYGVSIMVSKGIHEDDRYVFSVKLLPGTDQRLIGRYASNVRQLLGVEFFFPDISSSIKLIVSEKPLKECSLHKMLESQKFIETKMEIPYAVGYDMMGEMVIADVEQFSSFADWRYNRIRQIQRNA